MKPLYRIKDWKQRFETHESRKREEMRWVAVPIKQDGKGRRRLVRHENGPALFGAWNALLQVAARCPDRGVLADDDGPLDAIDLQDITDIPAELFDDLFAVLTDPDKRIGWLEVVEPSETGDARHGATDDGTAREKSGQTRTRTLPNPNPTLPEQDITEPEEEIEIDLGGDSDSDSPDRIKARQRWLLSVERFWSSDIEQRRADQTDTHDLFDEYVWPVSCRDGPERMRHGEQLVNRASRNGRNKMAYLKNAVKKDFDNAA